MSAMAPFVRPVFILRAAARPVRPTPAAIGFIRLVSSSTSSSSRPASSSSAPPSHDPHPYLSQLDRAGATSANTGPNSGPSLGPFPLPHLEREARIHESGQKWRQLGAGGKAKVAATQGASFVVVTFGAGLLALVVYAFGSELFSEASPTRVFEDCVERVRADQEVRPLLCYSPCAPSLILGCTPRSQLSTILPPPLSFHGSASSTRMRRNRRISSSLSVDPRTGAETLFVRFYVEGTDPLAAEAQAGETWLDWAKRWIGPAVWEDSHRPGGYAPRLSNGLTEEEEEQRLERERRRAVDDERRKSWTGWASSKVGGVVGSMFGGLGGLRTGTGADGEAGASGPGLFRRARKPRLGEYTTGEVVAELQKVRPLSLSPLHHLFEHELTHLSRSQDPVSSHFVYQQLFVALPGASAPPCAATRAGRRARTLATCFASWTDARLAHRHALAQPLPPRHRHGDRHPLAGEGARPVPVLAAHQSRRAMNVHPALSSVGVVVRR